VAGRDQFGDRRRGHTDPIFVNLDFLRHPDAHYSFAPAVMISRAYRRPFLGCPHRLQRRNGSASWARPYRHFRWWCQGCETADCRV
jgi:hypothetical protein